VCVYKKEKGDRNKAERIEIDGWMDGWMEMATFI
jgi:hypothetical protein